MTDEKMAAHGADDGQSIFQISKTTIPGLEGKSNSLEDDLEEL